MKQVIIILIVTINISTNCYAYYGRQLDIGYRLYTTAATFSPFFFSTKISKISKKPKSKESIINDKIEDFVDDNLNNLATDIAVGHGETLNALSEIIQIKDRYKITFFIYLKNNFDFVFPSEKLNHKNITKALILLISKFDNYTYSNIEFKLYESNKLIKLGKYKEANDILNKISTICPDNWEVYNNKGKSQYYLEKYNEAIELFRKVIKVYPESLSAWFYMGLSYYSLKEYNKSIMAYEECIKINPNDYCFWLNKGASLNDAGRYEEALACHEKAIKLRPKNSTVWSNKGVSLENLNRYSEALEAYNMSISIDKNEFALKNKERLLKKNRKKLIK